MGRESRRGKIFLASEYCCRFRQMGKAGGSKDQTFVL
jgi:hypothetical protein